jgi:hypothetical protein
MHIMKISGKMWSASPSAYALFILAASIIIISPVAATFALSDVSFSPNPPMVPAQPQQVSAKIWIMPSGATTFASGHAIQLQTTLENAQWDIQVIVDRLPASHQSAQGSATFINGAVVSYPTNRDVSLVINVSGTVPAGAGSLLAVIQAEEIDNNGSIVPGSVITITQPTTVTPGTSAIPTVPPVKPVKTTQPTPSPTRAPGFSLLGGISALCIVSVLTTGYYSRERNRKNSRP